MSKPKIYQIILNLKMTLDFKNELKDVAELMGVKLSDMQRAALYMFMTYYKDDVFGKKEKKNEFFKSWIAAAKDHEKYFIAKEFLSNFETDKASEKEKRKMLKIIEKHNKKFEVK